MDDQTKKCPYCAEAISIDAIKCKHCGEILDNDIRTARQQSSQIVMPTHIERKWNPGVAAVLSLIIPGAGQIYKGNIGSGIFWLIIVSIGYFLLVIPGLILHLICIVTATSGNPYKN